MHPNEQKQQFSVALTRAIAAACGLAYSTPETDDDSVDATLARRGGGGTIRSPRLDVQLKCTAGIDLDAAGATFPFLLPLKNYDDLRASDVMVPRILVVALVPEVIDDWAICDEHRFVLRRTAFWASLRGLPPSSNTSKVSVLIPRDQVLTPATLKSIFERLAAGQLP